MNYLVLTPDGVGSTILQRLIAMTLYLENHSVVNTHELTNGLELKNGIAAKNFDLKYTQSLEEIANILQDSDKKITLVSRLAKYHIDNRKDRDDDCSNFYKFLNKHFERKIMCVRENIFEYAMSWSIRDRTGVLNVYGEQDRDKVSQVSEVDEKFFIKKCQEYVRYVEWVQNNFSNIDTLSYENMIKYSDDVMQKLTGHKNTFKDKLGTTLTTILTYEYNFLKNKNEINFNRKEMKALARYKLLAIELIKKNIVLGVPLKNTTLTDKKNQIKNFDNCLNRFYEFAKNHNWIDQSKATYDYWNEKYIC